MVDLKRCIVDFVRSRPTASFTELDEHLGGGYRGHQAIHAGGNENMIFWMGMSQEYADAVCQLLEEGALVLRGTTILVYFVDGKCLTLPLARGNYRYKDPHWVPAVLDVGRKT